MQITIYHNPRCSKSRQALAFLQAQQVHPINVVEYLKTPPTANEIAHICTLLGCEPHAIIRTKEAYYSEQGLGAHTQKSTQEWCQLVHDNPILLERPIVVFGNQAAALGRPDTASIAERLASFQ